MPQVRATCDHANSGFRSDRFHTPKEHTKTLFLGICGPLANVKAVHDEGSSDVGRIAAAIEAPVDHERVEAIHPTRQKHRRSPQPRWRCAPCAPPRLDERRAGWHALPG